MATPAPANDRIVELDAIRGLAALAVLATHLPRGFWFGETGVDLFFVLSGYLITSIILKHHDRPGFLKTFYFRRALRIFPIYYLAILTVLLLNAIRRTPEPISGIEYYLFYIQNISSYWGGKGPAVGLSLGHTWTLAIEEQFYLIWPAAMVVLKPRPAAWLCAALVALPVVLRAVWLNPGTLFGHTDGLALGAGLAYLGAYSRRAFSLRTLPIYAGVTVAAFTAYTLFWIVFADRGGTGKQMVQNTYAISLVSMAYTALVGSILCVAGGKWAAILRLKPLIWVGTISYGLYLYHWIIYEWLDILIKFGRGYNDPWWLDVVKVMASFIVAMASWKLIEQPLLRFKDAFSYRRDPADMRPTDELPSAAHATPVREPM